VIFVLALAPLSPPSTTKQQRETLNTWFYGTTTDHYYSTGQSVRRMIGTAAPRRTFEQTETVGRTPKLASKVLAACGKEPAAIWQITSKKQWILAASSEAAKGEKKRE
jgi:hypothetical protein